MMRKAEAPSYNRIRPSVLGIVSLGVYTMVAFAGCEVIDPPHATTLSPLPAVSPAGTATSDDTFVPLTLSYPAAKITERNQVPVGDYLRSAFRNSLPNAEVVVKAWEPSAEVKGVLGPHVVIKLGFEFVVVANGVEKHVADFMTADVGALYVSHFSLTGLHSIDSHEVSGPIHNQLRPFLDTVVEKVKWRLRE